MKEVTGKELKELIESGKTVVCDFWAAWCGPCRMLAPVLETLFEEFKEQAEFVKLNIDDETETALSFGVMSIPDVFIFQNGAVKTHSLGFVPEAQLREFLKNNL